MKLSNFFIPHPETHKKAHLISWEALIIYVLLFIFLQASFNLISSFKPGVLGINSNVDQKELINLTNAQRAKYKLPNLAENDLLNQAALEKAKNMFEENYWAHYSPSGKNPWGFITGSGYKFSFAGENLARNFYNSDEVVAAWMASPSHKENIVSSKYKEIGIAVVEGVLRGQKTTLVVQMFGSPPEGLALRPNTQNSPPDSVGPVRSSSFASVEGTTNIKPIPAVSIDHYLVLKSVGLSLIVLVFGLLTFDLIILKKRGVVRLASSHMPHLALLGLSGLALFNLNPGQIL